MSVNFRLRGIYADQHGNRWACLVIQPSKPIDADQSSDAAELYLMNEDGVTATKREAWSTRDEGLKDTGRLLVSTAPEPVRELAAV